MGQKINIEIGHKAFELIAETPEKEELYRKAVKLLNRHIDSYQTKFQNKSMNDILSFVALGESMHVVNLMEYIEKMEKEVEKLQTDLDSYLEQTEISSR